MFPNVCLLVFIGLPAAGKSTYCQWLLKAFREHFKIIHFCYDDFFQYNQNFSTTDADYKAQRLHILDLIKTIAQAVKNSQEIPEFIKSTIQISENFETANNFLILCDDNHYYRSMRHKLYQLCNQNELTFCQIYFECDEKLSLQRNALRPDRTRVPESVIAQMAARLEPPDNFYWEADTLRLSSDNPTYSIDNLLTLITCALKKVGSDEFKPPHTLEIVDHENKISLLHKLDLMLRRRMKELLTKHDNEWNKKSKAEELNIRRKEILQDLRRHDNLSESSLSEFVDLLNVV